MGQSSWTEVIQALLVDLSSANVREFEATVGSVYLRIRRQPGARSTATGTAEQPVETGPVVLAPLAGVFYRASSPNAEPYVREGDAIEEGQTVGLIEAMKVFNEIKVDQAGIVAQFLVENGQLVAANQPLVRIAAES